MITSLTYKARLKETSTSKDICAYKYAKTFKNYLSISNFYVFFCFIINFQVEKIQMMCHTHKKKKLTIVPVALLRKQK